MSTYTIADIIEFINEKRAEGMTDAKIKAHCTLLDWAAKDVSAAFKELGGTKRKAGFAAAFYDWLAVSKRTQVEAADYILGYGEYGETSKNVQNHKSHYMNIWELSVTIWNSKVEETSAGDPEVAAAFAKLNKAKAEYERTGRKPRKTQFHPDKVSHLNDAELTAAYTEFFQELNTRKAA